MNQLADRSITPTKIITNIPFSMKYTEISTIMNFLCLIFMVTGNVHQHHQETQRKFEFVHAKKYTKLF